MLVTKTFGRYRKSFYATRLGSSYLYNRRDYLVYACYENINVCVCVLCVFFPFILDINGRTNRGHTGFLIHLLSAVHALIFLGRRIQPFLSLIDREVEFCVLTI